jgi:HK97 family phage major capsid protein
MVDPVGGALVLKSVPRLNSGAAVAIQGSQNATVQETDPADAAISTPVGWLAGQVDMSRQAFDRSRPGLDEAIATDLGSDFGTKLDVQLISGSGSTGAASRPSEHLRGA